MKYLFWLFLFLLPSSEALAQTVIHTISWENGVNRKLVKEWSLSLDRISNVSSDTYIRKKFGGKDKLHRVGHRDVIVWIPSTTDLSKDFTVVIWFHGHYGFVPSRTFEDRTLRQLVPLSKNKNFVLVVPEMPWSVHAKTPTKRNSLLWMKKGDFLGFVEQVKGILIKHRTDNMLRESNAETPKTGFGKIDYRIVGHSAGGSTIKRLGITGDLCKINPSMVVWSDSSYGSWLRNAWDGCLANHRDILVKVFVVKGGTPWRKATQFMGQFQGPPENLELHIMKPPKWSHKLIGDNVVSLSFLLNDE